MPFPKILISVLLLFTFGCKTSNSLKNMNKSFQNNLKGSIQNYDQIQKNVKVSSAGKIVVLDFNNQVLNIVRSIELKGESNLQFKNARINTNSPYFTFVIDNASNISFDEVHFDAKKNAKPVGFIKIRKSKKIKVENCSFKNLGDGSKNIRGIAVNNTPDVIIRKNEFENLVAKKGARAIAVVDTKLPQSKNVFIQNNKIGKILPRKDGDGIYVESPKQTDINVVIENNQFKDNPKRFIKVNASGAQIRNNKGTSSAPACQMLTFVAVFGNNILIEGNQFSVTGKASVVNGVILSKGALKNLTIKNNILSGSSKTGSKGIFLVDSAQNITIENNTFTKFHIPVQSSRNHLPKINGIKIKGNTIKTSGKKVLADFHGSVKNLNQSNNTLDNKKLEKVIRRSTQEY